MIRLHRRTSYQEIELSIHSSVFNEELGLFFISFGISTETRLLEIIPFKYFRIINESALQITNILFISYFFQI